LNKEQAAHTVEVLRQAFPYLKRFRKQYIVIKLGGSLISDADLLRGFAEDVGMMRLIGMYPVLVHGGGPHISASLKEAGIETHFKDGMRVTDGHAIKIVESALSSVNEQIVSHINESGFQGKGYASSANSPVLGKAISEDSDEHVGKVSKVDLRALKQDVLDGVIPVLSPIAQDSQGTPLNINADTVAGEVASAIMAAKFILLTDVSGVRVDGKTIPEMNSQKLKALIRENIVAGGMLPKALCALDALDAGIAQAHIIDGRLAHAVLLEIFTEKGVGTLITP
jgi:acetylglutamate kinase